MCAKICGLLGEKLGHSFSPQIHSMLADYDYSLFPTPKDELEKFMKCARWDAINVTIPYKESVMPYLDFISDEAAEIGCVNTVVRKGDKLYGYNTDFYGFEYLVKSSGIEIKKRKCLILGSGGASKTVKYALEKMGAGEIIKISRNGPNNYDNLHIHHDAQVIVNTTPVGMYPDNLKSPVKLCNFKKCEGAIDVIYNPAMTAFLLEAQKLGIKFAGGLTMLVAQAKKASEIFEDTFIDDGVMEEIISKLRRQMMNIVLIGMPGCGKSTDGTILAQKLGRELIDTDQEIAKTGRTPAQIICEDGEEAFRKAEHTAILETAKLSSKIIATGGGAVTRRENYAPLHQNSIIIFIDRAPDLLTSENRPLSQSKGIEKLYRERLPLYKEFADATVNGNGTPHGVADEIIKAMEKLL